MSGRDAIGLFNMAIIAAVLGGITYLYLTLTPEEYDSETLCLAGALPPHRVVIIDKTDLYSPEQAAGIEQTILSERDALAVGERLSLYELNESGQLRNTNSFSLCNPGAGEQVNPLYRNPERIQARYEALFAEPLDRALADLVLPKDAPSSPIIEALARLAQHPSFDNTVPGRRIVLVSDMLQNSEIFSVYGRRRGSLDSRIPPADTVATAIRDTYGDSLRGVTLEIRLIPRQRWEADQHGALMAYWDTVFNRLGVAVRWSDI
ncbi:hypothetical protein AWH62_03000 [Maricaulis sp. W15]|uniref:hypothetical protein n=1 Tax=Maricaulis sp. W15 TaxID=1772333 RepID=UPI0009489291|nr:hypothetical protein [Maricaulis sp. W15]OLF77657.1 hypothetical protein AWH62_03000 [Maricaulis sp. W15]